MRRFIFTLSLSLAALPAIAQSAAPAISADSLAVLRGAHAIAPEVARAHHAAFVAAGLDRAQPRYVRMRAVSALSMVDRPEIRRALAALADAEGDDAEVRAQALHALAFLDASLARPRLERAARSNERALRDASRIVTERLAR